MCKYIVVESQFMYKL